jgi:xanthine dehydrogenase accessory factor
MIESIHSPIGLGIGAETPEEIALSILAEILMLRKGGSGKQLKLPR